MFACARATAGHLCAAVAAQPLDALRVRDRATLAPHAARPATLPRLGPFFVLGLRHLSYPDRALGPHFVPGLPHAVGLCKLPLLNAIGQHAIAAVAALLKEQPAGQGQEESGLTFRPKTILPGGSLRTIRAASKRG